MIYFQPVRTQRFTFQLKELTIGEIRTLLNINPDSLEKARSAFLQSALKELNWHSGYEHLTLAHLTAQERMFIETTYLSGSSDTPDFAAGIGHYSDFLRIEKQFTHDEVALGTIAGDEDVWHIRPLTGAMLEVIEERLLMSETATERADWVLYAMAAQLFRPNETLSDPYDNPLSYGDWLDERVEKLKSLPESAFISLLRLFFQGLEQLNHLFQLNFDHAGVMVISYTEKLNEEGEMAPFPARFRPTTVITLPAKRLFGKSKQGHS